MRQVSIFRNRNFVLFFGGQLISRLGDGIYTLGLVWMMHVLTNSTLYMSFTLAAGFIPRIIFGPVAGVFVDRWSNKWTLIVTDAVRFLLMVILTLLTLAHMVSALMLIIFAFVLATSATLFSPSYSVLQKRIVKEDELRQANSLQQVSLNIAQIAGPAIAGVTIGTLGLGASFAIDAATFLVSLAGLSLVHVAEPVHNHEKLSFRNIVKEMAGGVSVVRGLPQLSALTPFMLGYNFVLAAVENLLIVQFLANVLHQGALTVGIVTASEAVGELISGMALTVSSRHWISTRGMLGNMVISALCVGAMGYAHFAWIVAVLMFIVGFCMSIVNISFFTGIQQAVPTDALGRVWALLGALFDAATPLGQVIFGSLTAILPVAPTINFLGAAAALTGASAFLHPAIRKPQPPDSDNSASEPDHENASPPESEAPVIS